jgi:hypothetical protein
MEMANLIECLWFLCSRYGKLPIDPKVRVRGRSELAAIIETYAQNGTPDIPMRCAFLTAA